MTDARTQAIEYRRQLLRIVDQIERDYKLGKYAPAQRCETETVHGTEVDLSPVWRGNIPHIDTQPEKV